MRRMETAVSESGEKYFSSSDGEKYFRSGDFVSAVSCFSQLIDQNSAGDSSKLALLYNNRGLAKYMMVDFYTAKDDFDMALTLDPSLSVAYYNRGTISYRMGDFKAALEDFVACTKMNPDNAEFQEGLQSCQQCLAAEK